MNDFIIFIFEVFAWIVLFLATKEIYINPSVQMTAFLSKKAVYEWHINEIKNSSLSPNEIFGNKESSVHEMAYKKHLAYEQHRRGSRFKALKVIACCSFLLLIPTVITLMRLIEHYERLIN